MCKFLIDEYGWQGAQWIVCAIVLNGLVLGAVYRPITFTDLERVRRKWRRKQLKHARKDASTDTQTDEASDMTKNTEVDNKSDDSSLNSFLLKTTEIKMQEKSAMLPRVVHLQNGSSVSNLRMRTVSNSSVDRSEGNLWAMRGVGDSCHSLTWYASSMERLHPRTVQEGQECGATAPEKSGLSIYSRASHKVGGPLLCITQSSFQGGCA